MGGQSNTGGGGYNKPRFNTQAFQGGFGGTGGGGLQMPTDFRGGGALSDGPIGTQPLGGNAILGDTASGMAPSPTTGFTPQRAIMERARNNGMFDNPGSGGVMPMPGAPDATTGFTPQRAIMERMRNNGMFGAAPAAAAPVAAPAIAPAIAAAPAVPQNLLGNLAGPANAQTGFTPQRAVMEEARAAGAFGGAPQAGIQTLGAGADPTTGMTGMRSLFERLRGRGAFG